MNKLISTLLALLISSSALAAPTGVISGRVVDAADSTAVPGAFIELTPASGASPRYTTSGARGAFSFEALPYGDYALKITFLGYADLERNVTLSAATRDLGRLRLEQSSEQIDEVVIQVQAMRTSQRGDTVSYNAAAFKVAADADAEGLLAKMPGITVEDGEVTAQGETVQKIFVDGREFFGDDVGSAIKNLPAEAIDKVEVYNRLSDNAEFTGVDDGEGYKAINIVTKVDMRQGQFGKLYAGYAPEDKYVAGGSVNFFSGTSRIALIGLSNNMNQQNFSSEDILGVSGSSSGRGGGGGMGGFRVPQQNGISRVNSLGINYTDSWGKKLTFQGSYFFNTSDNENTSATHREYYSTSDIRRLYQRLGSSDAQNFNHRFNARLDYKISDRQSLMWRPAVSIQRNDQSSDYLQLNGNGRYVEGQSTLLSDTLNAVLGDNSSESSGYNISNALIYRIRLGEGRTITLDGNLSVNHNESEGYNRSLTGYMGTRPDSLLDRHNLSDVNRLDARASATYTEPLGEKTRLNVEYRYSYSDQPSNRRTYLGDGLGHYEAIEDARYSNIFASYYTTQTAGLGINHGGEKTRANAEVSYQTASLDGDRTYPLPEAKTSADFRNIVYFGRLDQTFSPNTTLRVTLRSDTENPSVRDLQEVVDISNPQSASSGNAGLKPEYEHELRLNFNRSNITKGRTFMVSLGGAIVNNYITDSLVQLQGDQTFTLPNGVVLSDGAEYTRPVNLEGYREARGQVSFGTPLGPLKSNLNLNAGVGYQRMPSVINGLENISSTWSYRGGATLSSNISENIDFTLRYNIAYNTAGNTINARDDNAYLNHRADGNFKWVAWGGITLSASAGYTRYSGITDDFVEEYCLLNAAIGKKIFRNQRGEVNVGVNDLLNQNRSYRRSFSDTYVQTSTNRAMGRYVGINFIYNLRSFGKGRAASRASSTAAGPEDMPFRSPEGGRPEGMGRPGGQGGPGARF